MRVSPPPTKAVAAAATPAATTTTSTSTATSAPPTGLSEREKDRGFLDVDWILSELISGHLDQKKEKKQNVKNVDKKSISFKVRAKKIS